MKTGLRGLQISDCRLPIEERLRGQPTIGNPQSKIGNPWTGKQKPRGE
jgi:hypothetical protein